MSSDELDIVFTAAHPDDLEIGMGGTIASLAKQGYRVGIVDLTDGEPTPREARLRLAPPRPGRPPISWTPGSPTPCRCPTAN